MTIKCKQVLLAVDDNHANLQILAECLGDTYEVVCFLSGKEMLDMVDMYKSDLILLDIQMPGMDGFEVCRRLKEMDSVKEIPVIFLTGMSEHDDEIKGLEYGAVDYITKPFSARNVQLRVSIQMELWKKTRLLEERTRDLEAALENIRTMKEIIPICMYCKKIRDDDGYWDQLEKYISEHTGSNFSHGICPGCMHEHFDK